MTAFFLKIKDPYFLITVSVVLTVVSAAGAAIAAESVAGAAAGAGAGAAIVVSVVSVFSVDSLLPQEATKRPIARANMLNFTNFMT